MDIKKICVLNLNDHVSGSAKDIYRLELFWSRKLLYVFFKTLRKVEVAILECTDLKHAEYQYNNHGILINEKSISSAMCTSPIQYDYCYINSSCSFITKRLLGNNIKDVQYSTTKYPSPELLPKLNASFILIKWHCQTNMVHLL